MVIAGLIALLAFGAVFLAQVNDTKAEIDETLERAVRNDPGEWGIPEFFGGGAGGDEEPSRVPVYCTTNFGGRWLVNANSTATMDEELASEAADAAVAAGERTGTLADYGLFYQVQRTDLGFYRVALTSTSFYEQQARGLALRLVGTWVALMVIVFVITVLLSRFVVRPVRRAWDEQQRFIADASHELKTPLTVILADASILQSNPEKTVAEQQAWVEGISAEASRMQKLTEDMLTLAQADSGVDMGRVMSDIDLSELVERTLLQFDAVAFERGLMIEDAVDAGLHVRGDVTRVENMLKTLLENACKYSAKPGTIDVSLGAERGSAVLAVHNAGEPIPAEDLPHLFDRFYRSDKSRAQEGESASFGLGLSIAKSTAELHGGSIEAASDEAGTTFVVRLPLAR